MDKNSVHCTTPTPTPSSPRCWSLPSWSASMSECGSAPDGRDSFPPFAILGFVAETHRSSYGALPRTSPPQLRLSRNESPSAREGLVSTIYKIGFVAATHRTSYDAFFETSPPPRNESPFGTRGTRFHHLQDWVCSCNPPQQLRCASKNESPAAKRVPLQTGGTRFLYLPNWVRSCNPPQQLRGASKNESLAAKRVPHPGHREQVLFTESTCAVHNRRQNRRCSWTVRLKGKEWPEVLRCRGLRGEGYSVRGTSKIV